MIVIIIIIMKRVEFHPDVLRCLLLFVFSQTKATE